MLAAASAACGGTATDPPNNLPPTASPVGPVDPTNTPTPSPHPPPTPNPVVTPADGTQSRPTPSAVVTPADGTQSRPTPSPVVTPTAGTQSPSTPTQLPTRDPLSTPEATDPPATAPPPTPEEVVGLVVTVGEANFQVELATTVEEQVQGLSGRSSLAPGEGMLFVYEQPGKYLFWMKDMRLPLDIVWIGTDCTVVDVTRNAPPQAPDQSTGQLPKYSPEVPAQYVLEINAGEADSQNILPGDTVEFIGALVGRFGC